jgi:probable HAF family extracellular repeat protein
VLPGGASSEATRITDNGLIAGDSQNGETDPLIPGFPQIRAVLWKQGEMIDLGTLDGGYESITGSVNSQGQVVGLASNGIPDPDSMVGLGYQARAFLWQNGAMQDLGTLGGPDAVAFLVNERGQVAGNSYTSFDPSERCAQLEIGPLTTGAFLWEKGTMKDLGHFGGTCTFAVDLNNRGQVVGASALAGDQGQHPFLWDGKGLIDLSTFGGDSGNAVAINEAGDAVGWATYPDQTLRAALWSHGKGIKDLGTLADYPLSSAVDINASGQVLGVAFNNDFTKTSGFLWENGGRLVDLNSLIPPGSDLQLASPETINDRGEIAGNGLDADGNQHAFLMIPCSEDCGDTDGRENISQQIIAAKPGPAHVARSVSTRTQPNPTRRVMPSELRARLARRYLLPGFARTK